MRPGVTIVAASGVALLLGGCFALVAGDRGPEGFQGPRRIDPAAVALPDGYRIEAVAAGFTFPTDVAFDADGRPVVVEAGYSYGEAWRTPRLVRVEADGTPTTLVEGGRNGPWTGAVFLDGAWYISEGGELEGGRLLRHRAGRPPEVVLENLPTRGDHHTNGLVLGRDGWLYMGLGTATNSAVVGPDNARFGWLGRFRDFHDTPCRDIRLAGVNYPSDDPLADGTQEVRTGAFVPFGTATAPGQTVRGAVPCSGAIIRVRPQGGAAELVAWGLRNPFGLTEAPDGTIYIANNEYDARGSRPVWGAGDTIYRLRPGAWYGWPDFHAGQPVYEGARYKEPMGAPPARVLAEHPGDPPEPVAILGVHAAATGIALPPDPGFGYQGRIFVAEFGDLSPESGDVWAPVGHRVAVVDPATGVVEGFAENREKAGPASATGSGGLERPVSVRFAPDGRSLYIVDFGALPTTEEGARPTLGTGVLWRVTRAPGAVASAGGGP